MLYVKRSRGRASSGSLTIDARETLARLSADMKAAKKRKYRNVPTIVDGMRFDSKAEARRYGELKLLRQAGEVLWFVRQVPFHLPGNIRYVADFLIVWSDGRTTVEDVKGVLTRVAANKIKQVRALLGVEVQLVGRRR